jgi:hypothetical protein
MLQVALFQLEQNVEHGDSENGKIVQEYANPVIEISCRP